MAEATNRQQDPRQIEPKPPYPKEQQQYPGFEAQMRPQVDHGEQSYRGHGKLTDKKALITGADSGIGRAVALAFAREGADVLVSYLREEEDARETSRLVEEAGRNSVIVAGDIQDESHCRKLVQTAFDEFGRLDILVNNAGFQMAQTKLDDFTSEQFERTFRTNVFAMFYLCKAALPKMEPGACIINTASIESFTPAPYLLDYAASKCAIVGFTKALSKLAGKQGVRVNAVAPGATWTPLIPATMPKEEIPKFGQDSALGRAAQPAEIAPAYVFLASPEASYMTGEVLAATGGRTPY